MSVKITDNTGKVLLNITNGGSTAIRMMAQDVVKTARPKTPYKSGDLSRSPVVRTQTLGATLTWDKDYAAAQEVGRTRGRPIRKYSTAGTGKWFARNAIRSVTEKSDNYFKRYIR